MLYFEVNDVSRAVACQIRPIWKTH